MVSWKIENSTSLWNIEQLLSEDFLELSAVVCSTCRLPCAFCNAIASDYSLAFIRHNYLPAYAITSLSLFFFRTNALLQIQGFLRNQQSADAVALLRAARWSISFTRSRQLYYEFPIFFGLFFPLELEFRNNKLLTVYLKRMFNGGSNLCLKCASCSERKNAFLYLILFHFV